MSRRPARIMYPGVERLLRLEEEVHADCDRYAVNVALAATQKKRFSASAKIAHLAGLLTGLRWRQPSPLEDWVKLRHRIEREFAFLTVVRGRLPMLVWPRFLPANGSSAACDDTTRRLAALCPRRRWLFAVLNCMKQQQSWSRRSGTIFLVRRTMMYCWFHSRNAQRDDRAPPNDLPPNREGPQTRGLTRALRQFDLMRKSRRGEYPTKRRPRLSRGCARHPPVTGLFHAQHLRHVTWHSIRHWRSNASTLIEHIGA